MKSTIDTPNSSNTVLLFLKWTFKRNWQINVREYRRGYQKWTIPRNWQINVREYWRGNQKWTIQRNWKHSVHKTKKNKLHTVYRTWRLIRDENVNFQFQFKYFIVNNLQKDDENVMSSYKFIPWSYDMSFWYGVTCT